MVYLFAVSETRRVAELDVESQNWITVHAKFLVQILVRVKGEKFEGTHGPGVSGFAITLWIAQCPWGESALYVLADSCTNVSVFNDIVVSVIQ